MSGAANETSPERGRDLPKVTQGGREAGLLLVQGALGAPDLQPEACERR